MNRVTFNNGMSTEQEKTAKNSLLGVLADLDFYREHGTNPRENEAETIKQYVEDNEPDAEIMKAFLSALESISPFDEYSLSFDYCGIDEEDDDQESDYFRFQMSWGGPSDELRFYENGAIEYVYLDWFVGIGFDVTKEEGAQFVKEWFNGCEMMVWEEERAKFAELQEI